MRGRPAAALLLLALLAALGSVVATAAPAHAAGYRYWSFWQADPEAGDGWVYAQQGPGISRPSDGDVEGWRFAVSEDSREEAAKPRGKADFAAVCADTPARDGTKRIALVIDFGTPADAPEGERPPDNEPRTECAQVAEDATSADALAAVAKPLRYDTNALLCAIAGYPESGCGETVSSESEPEPDSGAADETDKADKTDAADKGDGDGSPALGLVAGGAAVAVLGAAAVWQARRRRT